MRKWVCNGVEFKVGDKVRVMRRVKDNDPDGMGEGIPWQNNWIAAETGWAGMDGFLGLTFEIEDITAEGATFVVAEKYRKFVEHDAQYAFPLSCLDKVAA